MVADAQRDGVSLAKAQRGSGQASVHQGGGARPAGEIDRHRADLKIERGSREGVGRATARVRPRVPRAECEGAAEQALHELSS